MFVCYKFYNGRRITRLILNYKKFLEKNDSQRSEKTFIFLTHELYANNYLFVLTKESELKPTFELESIKSVDEGHVTCTIREIMVSSTFFCP